jgi:hypothetical protein
MSLPVTIEDQALRVEMYPHLGGKVLSVVDKADEYELLFDYPAELPTSPQYDQPYPSSYYAGWDECFPAVAKSTYPAHPYKDVVVPDHGELWGLPTTSVPTKGGITSEWNGLRFGYRLSRRIWIDGPSLHAEYALTNTAPFDFHFVWAMHALMSLRTPVEIELPRASFNLTHDADGRPRDTPFDWPVAAQGEDLSRPGELPPRRGWKVFSVEPISTPAVVRYPSRGRSVTIEYSSQDGLRAFWGVWINTGGWGGHKHFALEPTTGRFDELDRAVRDGSDGRVRGSGKLTWSVRWTVGQVST